MRTSDFSLPSGVFSCTLLGYTYNTTLTRVPLDVDDLVSQINNNN